MFKLNDLIWSEVQTVDVAVSSDSETVTTNTHSPPSSLFRTKRKLKTPVYVEHDMHLYRILTGENSTTAWQHLGIGVTAFIMAVELVMLASRWQRNIM